MTNCEKDDISKSISIKDLTCNVTSTNVTVHGGNDGTITVNVLTGNGDYIFSLNTSNTNIDGKFTSLSAGDYHVKVVDGENKVFSKDVTLTQPNIEPTKPTVEVLSVSDITQASATLNGKINPNGFTTTDLKFEYGESTSYGSSAVLTNVGGNTPISINKSITSLKSNTIYHYRLVATNSGGTTVSGDVTFTTLQVSNPTVNTLSSTNITQTTATLNGSVNPNGYSITALKFEYGVSTSYGSYIDIPIVSGNTLTNVTANIINLNDNATYHYRLVVVGDFDPVHMQSVLFCGNDMTFTTPQIGKPIVSISDAVVTQTTATLSGSVNTNGFQTDGIYFEYSWYSDFRSSTKYTLSNITSNTSIPVSCTITGLNPNATHYYRLVVSNKGGITTSETKIFITSKWKVGDEMFGGVIFKVDDAGQHGKVVQKQDYYTYPSYYPGDGTITTDNNGIQWKLPSYSEILSMYNNVNNSSLLSSLKNPNTGYFYWTIDKEPNNQTTKRRVFHYFYPSSEIYYTIGTTVGSTIEYIRLITTF